MNRKQLVYVENVPPTTTEEQLVQYLEKSAPVLQVYFLKEKQCTKRSLAAFVRVASEADVPLLLSRNQQNFRGKRLFMVPTDTPQQFQADLTIIVRNIHQKINEESLFDHFEDCGKITWLQVRTDDFAYIGFEDKTAVRHAMAKNNIPLKNSQLKVQILTRNVDIMIVNLDTLPNRMPELYRKLCQPVAPRANVGQQPEPMEQDPPLNQSQVQRQGQQQQQRPQQNQQQGTLVDKLKEKANQLAGKQPPFQQNQNQNQQQQQRQQNPQPQRNQTQQQQQNQQKQQQQQQQQNQQRQLQQQQNQQRQQQQQQQQQQQKLQQQQNQQKQQQQKQQQQPKPQPVQPVQAPKAPTVTNGQAAKPPQQTPVVETMDFTADDSNDFKADEMATDVEIVEDTVEIVDLDLDEVEIEEDTSTIPPIPSKYTQKPTDYMRAVKASELNLIDVELKSPGDRCAVWVNNIQPETRRLDIAKYMEQFGNVESFKVGTSKACFFTNWAKVIFCDEESADRAAEYFLHPFRGQYLFVLSCKKAVDEVPEKCFVIDYLSKYITYEDVVRAFKPVGEVFYMVRLYNNTSKVRIFFVKTVSAAKVLAIKTVDGCAIKVETFQKDMDLKIPKAKMLQYKESRDIITSKKAARIAKIYDVAKQEAHDRTNNRPGYVNPDVKKNPVEIIIHNVPKSVDDARITEFLKPVGEPTGIRRVPEPFDDLAEQVFVGFSTLSKALTAAQMSITETLGGFTPFVFTAWTVPAMKDDNTVKLRFEAGSNPTIQSIHDGMVVYGAVRYVSKTAADQAIVVFKWLNQGVQKATEVQQIGTVKVVSAEKFSSNSFTGPSKPEENTIVIDDDDEVVVVTSDVPANKGKANQDNAKPKPANNNQKRQQNQPQNQQRQQNQPQNQQRQQRPQQQFQNQREPSPSQELRQMFNRPNRNFQNQNSTQQQFQQRAQQFRMQQEQQMQQRAPNNPWQVPDPQIRPFIHENPREQFMRPNQNNQFRQNNFNNQFDRFGPGGGGGNQYGGPTDLFNRERPHPMDNMDDYGMRRDNFNRGQPMFVDDPPLDRFQEPIPPWRQRSPFGQQQQQPMFNRRDDDDEFGNIPPNIPEEDLDEYIMRKQEMIKRRLEQLDKQLICSVESSRQHDMDMPPRRGGGGGRPGATVISHTGDVHFVPNPAAAARARNNNPRGRNNQGGAGRPNRPNDPKGGSNANRSTYRNRNPFDDVEIVPIIRDRDGSPSPKRNREAGQKEDNFADRFNAAWS